MLKALALESFGSIFFPKTKKYTVSKVSKVTTGTWRFWLSAALIATNIVVLMSYVYGVNQLASSGYEIKSLQNRLSSLSEDNKKISLKISEASSMVSIQSDFLNSNFVAAGTPQFLGSNQLTQR